MCIVIHILKIMKSTHLSKPSLRNKVYQYLFKPLLCLPCHILPFPHYPEFCTCLPLFSIRIFVGLSFLCLNSSTAPMPTQDRIEICSVYPTSDWHTWEYSPVGIIAQNWWGESTFYVRTDSKILGILECTYVIFERQPNHRKM